MAKPDWITLSKNSGSGNDTVSIEAQPNAQRYCREGTITVNSGNGSISKQVKVLQYGVATYNLSLIFVGVQEGALFKISSCYYTFANDAAEEESSSYEIKVKLLNDGLPFQLPDGSSTITLLATINAGANVGNLGSKTFDTPFKIGSKTSLSFYTITAASAQGAVYVSKDAGFCVCTDEILEITPTSISAPAEGKTSRIPIKTQPGVTWTVE